MLPNGSNSYQLSSPALVVSVSVNVSVGRLPLVVSYSAQSLGLFLLLGESDNRETSADCSNGGSCSLGTNMRVLCLAASLSPPELNLPFFRLQR